LKNAALKNSEMPASPKTLSKEAANWWEKLMLEYELTDEAGMLILQTALEAFDRMRQAQAILKKSGLVVFDRFDQPKAHPLCTIERDSRNQMLLAIKQLNLDLEPLQDRVGRPSGS
jgi:P27 family predicted phage terminase small subunit